MLLGLKGTFTWVCSPSEGTDPWSQEQAVILKRGVAGSVRFSNTQCSGERGVCSIHLSALEAPHSVARNQERQGRVWAASLWPGSSEPEPEPGLPAPGSSEEHKVLASMQLGD